MKATERHHLKENEVAGWVMGARDWFEGNRNLILYGGLAILLVVAGVAGTIWYRSMSAGKGAIMLADAMAVMEADVVPPTVIEAGKPPVQQLGTFPTNRARLEAALPKLMAVAEAYPGQDVGIVARYRAAAALVGVGRTAEGIQRYNEVVAATTGVYKVMSQLGIAEAQVADAKFDAAVASYKAVLALNSEDAPTDGVLMQLARAYRLAGNTAEAAKTLKRVVDEFPQSSYAAAARQQMESEGPIASR